MRYRLRTLLIVLALGPLVIWAGWLAYEALASELVRAIFPVQKVQPARPGEVQTFDPPEGAFQAESNVPH